MAWYETKKGGTARITEKTATGEIATFTTVIGGLPLKSCAVGIQGYQEGTGDPTPVNKRPIITFTGASAVRTGMNHWDEEWEAGSIDNNGVNESSSTRIRSKNYITVKASTNYFFAWISPETTAFRLFYYDENKTFISYEQKDITVSSPNGQAFTTPANCRFVRFRTAGSGSISTYGNNISINYPSTETAYTPFTGNDTYSIAWKTEAGEVYSGTIDFATGLLTATKKGYIVDGSETYTFNTDRVYFYPPDIAIPETSTADLLKCSHFKPCAQGAEFNDTDNAICKTRSNQAVMFKSSTYTTSTATFIAYAQSQISAGTPITIVYELATPLTVQLTPTEIKTVLGVNYVWGDCGGNTSIVCYDGNVEHLDNLRDTYDSVNRPDAPTLIAGSTAFNYSALMSTSETIPQNMFSGCTAIQNVESPYVTTVGANAFAGATKLKYISLPNCTQVGAAAFSCQRTVSADKAYVKIDLPKCTTMGTRAFYKFGATDATAELEFPELTQIGSDCFSADGSSTAFTIKSIKLPKLAEAGSTAFQRMTAETIDIGSSCTQLNTTPLAYANVTNFICRATTPPALGSSAGLGGTNMTLTNIYVPDAALPDYTDNTNYPRWAKHAALMHPLSDIEPTT